MSAATTEEISAEVSKRICAHMNEDHAACVLGMALATAANNLSRNTKLTHVKLKKVTLSSCTISFVTCRGDVCEMNQAVVPFEPPLKSASDVRPRLIEIHHQVLSPKTSWLITDPLALIILVTCSFLGYCTYAFDKTALIDHIQQLDRLNNVLENISTGSGASAFALLIYGSWYFALVVHVMEAMYAAYHCRKTLKLKVGNTMLWFVLVSLVGYPIMSKLMRLVNAQLEARAEKTKQGKVK